MAVVINGNGTVSGLDIDSVVPSQSGNAGKALVTDGTDVSWGLTGGLIPIYNADSTPGTSSVSVDNIFTDDYDDYKVVMYALPSSDNTYFYMRLINESGGIVSASNYRNFVGGGEGGSGSSNNTQSYSHWGQADWQIRPAGMSVANNTAYGGIYLDLDFIHTRDSGFYHRVSGVTTGTRTGNDLNVFSGVSGYYDVNGFTSRGIHFFFSAGNVAELRIQVYGYNRV